jgi:hypothetical protein
MYGSFNSIGSMVSLTGDLYKMSMSTLPARNVNQLNTMLAKLLAWEKNPASGNWLHKGTTIVLEDGDGSDSMYFANLDSARTHMKANGYVYIDSFTSMAETMHPILSLSLIMVGVCNIQRFINNQLVAPFNVDPPIFLMDL